MNRGSLLLTLNGNPQGAVDRFQPEKLENIRITNSQFRLCGFRTGLHEFGQLLFIFGKTGSFVIEAGDLAFQLAYRPVTAHAFYLVEDAFEVVFNRNQLSQMREGKLRDDRPS